MLACVVRQFGSPAPTETTFYHGLRYGHAIERAAASPVFAGGRETAQYNARLLNNCICDDQLVESRYVRLLPITKIIVPEGTMLLDPNTFRPPCTDEDVRIFDGGLSATGNREKFTDNVFMYELTEYRLMVKP